jgi:hypothetical protein
MISEWMSRADGNTDKGTMFFIEGEAEYKKRQQLAESPNSKPNTVEHEVMAARRPNKPYSS